MAFNHQYISLSSSLLLRISPHTFAFIPILPMCLSSLNRSIYAVSRHILPCVAPLCKALHYSKTGVPWQMNSTRMLIIYLLKCHELTCFGAFCVLSKIHINSAICDTLRKIGQIKAKCNIQS